MKTLRVSVPIEGEISEEEVISLFKRIFRGDLRWYAWLRGLKRLLEEKLSLPPEGLHFTEEELAGCAEASEQLAEIEAEMRKLIRWVIPYGRSWTAAEILAEMEAGTQEGKRFLQEYRDQFLVDRRRGIE